MEDPTERLDKPLCLRREEERNKLKDDGWNSAAGFDANWSSLVNNAAENDSKYNFSLFYFVGKKEELGFAIMAEHKGAGGNGRRQTELMLTLTLA